LLDTGLNELRLVLSDGWFRGRTGPSRVPDSFGAHTAVVAQLSVESVDFTKLLYGDLSGVPPTWIIVGGDDNKCGSGYGRASGRRCRAKGAMNLMCLKY
jgi:acetyl esterase/lipase